MFPTIWDEEEDQEFPERLPPSKRRCERILGLFVVPNLPYLPTNTDLPHICPMEEYRGLDLFWIDLESFNMRFYDEIHLPDGSSFPASYYLSYVKPCPMIAQEDGLDELQDSDFKKFLENIK